MEKFLTIALLLLVAGLMSCTHDPKLDTARIATDEQVYIEEGKTYELILQGNETGQPCALLTNCEDKKVLSMRPARYEHDGQSKIATEYAEEFKVVFHCNSITSEKYQIIPALMTVVDTLGNLGTIEKGVLLPESGLNPGDVRVFEVEGVTYRLIKAKATNAFQLEQGENKIYFVLVPRA